MTLWLISPSPPTGNNRRIELAGIDLWIGFCTNRVFLYPSDLNIDQFKYALSRTLSMWPLVAGRFLLLDDDHYFIEMSDNPIPITYIENTELAAWPSNLNVVSDQHEDPLAPFIDEIRNLKPVRGSQEEPLLRLKLTCLKQSDEWILGVSWAHVLGDGGASIKFLNTLSRCYQNLEPLQPLPVFERRLWQEDEADQSLLSMMKYLTHAGPSKYKYKLCSHWEELYEQVNLQFSGKQLAKLRELAGGNNITIQDSLSAYICLTLNTHCYLDDAQHRIRCINTYVNFRGVSDTIAPAGVIANTIFMMPSDDFDDPTSLSHIARTLRRSILRSRDLQFLEPYLVTANILMRRNARDNLLPCGQFQNEMIVNSSLIFDWASLVDFGYTDKCRCYVPRTSPLFLRVFRLNPVKNGSEWLPRDRDGAEVAFGIEKNMKEKFLNAWQKDVAENFANVKQ